MSWVSKENEGRDGTQSEKPKEKISNRHEGGILGKKVESNGGLQKNLIVLGLWDNKTIYSSELAKDTDDLTKKKNMIYLIKYKKSATG